MDGKHPVEKFDGSDFGFWKIQIEDYLYGKDLYLPVFKEKPKDMKDEEWALMDRKAMSVIRLSLSREITHHTVMAKSTKELLDTLSGLYEKPSAVNKVHLIRRLFNLRMSESTGVAKHLSEFNMIIAQLSSVEIDFDDEIQALILLSSLPESWNGIVTAVSASAGKTKLKLNEVRDLMVSEEIRRRESSSNFGEALRTESKSRSEKSRGWRDKNRESKSSDEDDEPKKGRCNYCHKKGHWKRECPQRKGKKPSEQWKASLVEEDYSEALVATVSDVRAPARVGATDVGERRKGIKVLKTTGIDVAAEWILDSGCTYHMTANKAWLEDFSGVEEGRVLLGNGESCRILGKGSVNIRMFDGVVRTLTDVRYVPGLKRNLISLSVLDEQDYSFRVVKGVMKVVKGSLIVMKGVRSDGVYSLIGSTVPTVKRVSEKAEGVAVRHLKHDQIKGLQQEKLKDRRCFDQKRCWKEVCRSLVRGGAVASAGPETWKAWESR